MDVMPYSRRASFRVPERTATVIYRHAERRGISMSDSGRELLELGAQVASPLGLGISPHVCELMTDGVGRASIVPLIVDDDREAEAILRALEPFGWDQSPETLQRLASGQLQVVSAEEATAASAAVEALSAA